MVTSAEAKYPWNISVGTSGVGWYDWFASAVHRLHLSVAAHILQARDSEQSNFALPASCSGAHFLQLGAMLKKLSGETLLTVSG